MPEGVCLLERACTYVCTRVCVCVWERERYIHLGVYTTPTNHSAQSYVYVCVCMSACDVCVCMSACVYSRDRAYMSARVCACVRERDTWERHMRETHTSCRVQQSNASGHTILCALPTVQSRIFSRWNCEGWGLKLGWLASARPRLSQLLFIFFGIYATNIRKCELFFNWSTKKNWRFEWLASRFGWLASTRPRISQILFGFTKKKIMWEIFEEENIRRRDSDLKIFITRIQVWVTHFRKKKNHNAHPSLSDLHSNLYLSHPCTLDCWKFFQRWKESFFFSWIFFELV